MATLLRICGFKNMESLKELSLRYQILGLKTDDIFLNIFICHKNIHDLPDEDSIIMEELSTKEYQYYLKSFKDMVNRTIGETCNAGDRLEDIFKRIHQHFKSTITFYIFQKCYLFYQSGHNAFEPILCQFEIHKIIQDALLNINKTNSNSNSSSVEKMRSKLFRKWKLQIGRRSNFWKNHSDTNTVMERKHVRSPLLFESDNEDEDSFLMVQSSSKDDPSDNELKSKTRHIKSVSLFKLNEIYFHYDRPVSDLEKNINDPAQEEFNIHHILYNKNHTSEWPKNHPLSSSKPDEVLKDIIMLNINTSSDFKNKAMEDSVEWIVFSNILEKYQKHHQKLSSRNGFKRLLKYFCKKYELGENFCRKRKRNKLSQEYAENKGKESGRQLRPVPKAVVSTFIIDIFRRVLPDPLFGGKHCRRQFQKEIVRLVTASKHQSFLLLPFVEPFTKNQMNIKWCSEVKDDLIRNSMIVKTIKWIIFKYYFIILRTLFYVTETGHSNFELHYYLKDDMESCTFFARNDLLYYRQIQLFRSHEKGLFNLERQWLDTGHITKEDAQREVGIFLSRDDEYVQSIANVRLLPKKENTHDVRLITYFPKSRITKQIRKIKQIYYKRRLRRRRKIHIAKLLLELIVERSSCSIKPLPSNPALEKLWEEILHLKQMHGNLYFVKSDIADAFGSVNHDKLREILDESCRNLETEIQLKKCCDWKLKDGIPKIRYSLSFSESVRDNCIRIKCTNMGKSKPLPKFKVDFLKSVIEQVVFQQKIRISGKIFKMVEGLAQGSAGVLSPLLCDLYYSKLDHLYLDKFRKDSNCVLVRAADDYFFVSSDISKAKEFLNLIVGGISHYNTRFNQSKLITNIDSCVDKVTYLGLVFNFEKMNVMPSYTKYENKYLLHTMRLSGSRFHFNKFKALQKRMLRLTSLKLHSILLKDFNDIGAIRRTIYYASLFQANRFLVLTEYLYKHSEKNDLDLFILTLKCFKKILNLILSRCEISELEINWLYFYAFYTIFSHFSGRFTDLLYLLRHQVYTIEKLFQRKGMSMILTMLKNDIKFSCGWHGIPKVFQTMAIKKR